MSIVLPTSLSVVPAQAGTQSRLALSSLYGLWTPTCVGVTLLRHLGFPGESRDPERLGTGMRR